MVALLLAHALQPPASESAARAQATVRIVEGARISATDWIKSARRKERIIKDEKGQRILVRLIEFE